MNWVNYDDVLAQLQASGLLVDAIAAGDIGERRRCRVDGDKERRGWYHLHELRTDRGDTLLVGSYGVWRGNDPGTQKVVLKNHTLSLEQQHALRDRIKEDQKRDQARRRAEGERAARRADAMWRRLAETGESDYLQRKKVQAFGVRFSPSGAMAIPMLDVYGVVHGLQLIYPKGHAKAKRLGRDKDFWPQGIVKQGHFFLIGSPAAARVLLLAEGYATAASLHMATGLPVAVAWDAGNLVHVAKALAARYRGVKILVCADDDYLAKCRECGALTSSAESVCEHCGKEHRGTNAGAQGAQTAALAVDGAWFTPWFTAPRPRDKKGPTDFNDLHADEDFGEGLHVVRAQVEARLSALGWQAGSANAAPAPPPGEGEGGDGRGGDLFSITSVHQFHERFALVYEMSETVFDSQEHKLVPLSSMRNLGSSRQLHRQWMESIDKRIVRVQEVGFDPSERDPKIKCNLWGGWPTTPRAGQCGRILELGEYLCSQDARGAELWDWVLKWVAYPVQHPGAKMKTAIIMHGPQGTGKNVFWEAVCGIFGEYAKVIDQETLDDKFNDVFSRKLLLIADEVVSRQELYHSKNKLKHLVTGTEIRINPKNVGAYYERNCVNVVFLSNEPQPAVLERDDRRHCVIWTPPKLDAADYHAVLQEISEGGIEALHDYLLHLDLGDFGPATLPPMTQAKRDLIELSLDSSERFYNALLAQELPLPVGPVRTEDLYDAYRFYCLREGVAKPAQKSTIIGALSKRPGVHKDRPRHYVQHSQTTTTQSTVLWPPGGERDLSMADLSAALVNFSDALHRWKTPTRTPITGSDPRPQPSDEEAY